MQVGQTMEENATLALSGQSEAIAVEGGAAVVEHHLEHR